MAISAKEVHSALAPLPPRPTAFYLLQTHSEPADAQTNTALFFLLRLETAFFGTQVIIAGGAAFN
jgi:hypothetical protein